VTDRGGRTARFQSLGLLADSVTGAAVIRVSSRTLKSVGAPPRATRRRGPAPANPLKSFLPVR
jgi:hypothetical protein